MSHNFTKLFVDVIPKVRLFVLCTNKIVRDFFQFNQILFVRFQPLKFRCVEFFEKEFVVYRGLI